MLDPLAVQWSVSTASSLGLPRDPGGVSAGWAGWRPRRWALFAITALLASAGCARGPECAEGSCPNGTVCDLDGTCRAPNPVRVGPAVHLAARDFGGTRGDRRRSSAGARDELLLGGAAEGVVYLAFALPARPIERAVLVLHPAEGAGGGTSQTIRVARVRPFVGASLTHRRRPRRAAWGAARTLAPVRGRPILVEVSDLIERGSEVFHVAVHGSGDGLPWRIASPVAVDGDRAPRLDIALAPRRR